MTTDFTAATATTPTGPVLTFVGELDATTAPIAHNALRNLALHAGDQLVIDLAGLEFYDSSGISALIAGRNLAHAAGATIALTAVPQQLSRTLGLLGLAGFFGLHPSAGHVGENRTTGPTET